MSTATVNALAELVPNDKPRRTRRAQEKSDTVTTRFFMGDSGQGGISLTQEFASEVEAQLESLKVNRPYYTLESWRAVADLSNGSIAVQKRAASSKT
jgi:hypothetical protein